MADIEHDDYCPDKGDRRCDCDWEARVRADERTKTLADHSLFAEGDVRNAITDYMDSLREQVEALRAYDETVVKGPDYYAAIHAVLDLLGGESDG